MHYSIAKEIFGTPFYLSAFGLQQMLPVVNSMMRGLMFAPEDEPAENKPYYFSAAAFAPKSESIELDDDGQPVEDTEMEVEEKYVYVMPLKGVMMREDMDCGPRGTRTLGQRLRNADADPACIGHILVVDGPGGSANAIPEIADAITACTKPVVAWVDGMACSAHMYAISYAKERIAHRPTDWVGCVGTMLQWQGRTSKSEANLFGERSVTIYADEATEKNEEYETAINDFDFKLAKERILNPHNEKFIADMKANIAGVKDEHLHGRTFDAQDVVGSLIDSIGDFNYAVQRVVDLSGYKPSKKQNRGGGNNSSRASKINSQKIMSKKYLNIEQVLNSPDGLEFETDGMRTFSAEEMQTIDTALGQVGTGQPSAELEQATATIAEQTETIAANATRIAELEQEVAQQAETLAANTTEIATLRGQSAGASADARTTTDKVHGDTTPKAVSDKYENPLEAINEVAEAYLGRSINA